MTNDEIFAELGSMISNLSQRIHERDAVIAQLRDIIAEYEGVATPKQQTGNFLGTVTKMTPVIARRKKCPSCRVEHTVRKDGGMYKHMHWSSTMKWEICPGVWMTD